jgi:hypothetical protein
MRTPLASLAAAGASVTLPADSSQSTPAVIRDKDYPYDITQVFLTIYKFFLLE